LKIFKRMFHFQEDELSFPPRKRMVKMSKRKRRVRHFRCFLNVF
jgi:hypothetical protein